MKKWILICFCLSLFVTSKAQNNLVPNWSFENITSCPNFNIFMSGVATETYATPWQNPNVGNADLFSTCDTTISNSSGLTFPAMSTPQNIFGNQKPHT